MPEQLHRSLSLTQLVFYGVGTIVGAGIYTIIAAAAGLAGSGVWLSLLFAAAAALLTALSYAELISMYPRAGAEYHFIKEAFPRLRLAPFLAGFLIALNCAATAATVSLAFAGYLNVFVDWPAPAVALALLTLCTFNIAGIRRSTWATIGLICVEVGGLLLLIGAAFTNLEVTGGIGLPEADALGGVFAAAALAFFVYIGFENIANLAEEAKTPQRDVPRALLLSVAITSVLYLLVIWAVLAAMPVAELVRSHSPLTSAGGAVAPWLGQTLAVTALFATAGTALISLISISRLLFGMARGGDMPKVLSRTATRRKTPWVAALALFGAAVALLPLGEVKIIASISSLGILLVFIGVHTAVLLLRRRRPELERPFRVPGSIGRWPVLPLVGMVVSAALVTQFEPLVYAVTGGAIAAGAGIYLLTRRWRASPGRPVPHGR